MAVTYTFLSVLLTSMAGWALARYQFFGKGVVVAIILGTITLPYFVVVIPQFIMVARDFKLANTWVALIVPPLFNSLGVLFMRQSLLDDAARAVRRRAGRGRQGMAHLPVRRAAAGAADAGGAADHPVPALLEQLSLAAADQLQARR